jgi:hypothetical protein
LSCFKNWWTVNFKNKQIRWKWDGWGPGETVQNILQVLFSFIKSPASNVFKHHEFLSM